LRENFTSSSYGEGLETGRRAPRQSLTRQTALDELKTHLRGAQIVLRSKTPELVKQEFYGLLMAHFAVRGLMQEAALQAEEDPDRLSFLHSVRVVQRRMARSAAIPPRQRKTVHVAVLGEILQERCVSSRNRLNARGVKRKMSNYPLRPRKRQPCMQKGRERSNHRGPAKPAANRGCGQRQPIPNRPTRPGNGPRPGGYDLCPAGMCFSERRRRKVLTGNHASWVR
jgi:hypothetical protein